MTARATASRTTARNLLIFALKAMVAAVLITWLARSKSLDFGALRVLVQSPFLFCMNMLAWFVGSVILSTARWRLLLRLAGVNLPLWRGTQLQMMALFFNTVVPGNVGGDLLKALYVARDAPASSKPAILLVVVIERFCGLLGLLATGLLVAVIRWPTLWANDKTHPMILTVAVLTAASFLGPLVAIALLRRWGDRLMALVSDTSRIGRLAGQLLAAARLAAIRPRILIGALLISMTMHAISMALFTLLTVALKGGTSDYGMIATVFPIGLLSVVLPISPAGMGVGHVAFDQLFAALGLVGGATIFNVFLIGQISPSLVGVIPYLLMKSRTGSPLETTAETGVGS